MKNSKLLILFIALTAIIQAETISATPATALLNEFIAQYAKEEVSWKKDIRLNERPGYIAPGRQLGISEHMGYFSFVPKTWDDLTINEKNTLLSDNRLKAYIISTKKGSNLVEKDGQQLSPIDGGTTNITKSIAPIGNKKTKTPLLVNITAEQFTSVPSGEPITINIPAPHAN